MSSLTHFAATFIPYHMRRQIKELYLSTLILQVGVMMILVFEPIYLYTLGYSLQDILLFFLIVYVAYFILMPFGANFARTFGYEKSIIVSTFIYILYYLVFYFIRDVSWFFYVAPLLYALQKTFYWPAFHADFARFAVVKEDGKEISGISVLVGVVSIVAPFIAGIILTFGGFAALFMVASLFFICSNFPLITTKEKFTPKPFPYWTAYKGMFSAENRRRFLSYLGFGEELVLLVVWPVYIAIIVGNLFDVGAIVAVATLLTLLVTLYIGRSSDHGHKRGALRFGTIIYSLSWFIRLFIRGGWGIFFVDTLSRISKNILTIPLIALTYEDAKKKSVMQTIVLFEGSLVIGKLLAVGILYGLLFVVPDAAAYQTAFAVAGLMTLFYMAF